LFWLVSAVVVLGGNCCYEHLADVHESSRQWQPTKYGLAQCWTQGTRRRSDVLLIPDDALALTYV
jgi:hypothetical protein